MPTFKHTVLYCLFDSKWDKTNIMLEKNEDMLSLTGIMETGNWKESPLYNKGVCDRF